MVAPVAQPVMMAPTQTAVIVPGQAVVASSPNLVLQTAAVQPAPFSPAPPGTRIETTADKRVVRSVNGYDVSMTSTARPQPRMLCSPSRATGQVLSGAQ